jgi:hypothetical protein
MKNQMTILAISTLNGGENLVLQPGIDNKTHLNLLTSYRSLPPGVLPGEYAG